MDKANRTYRVGTMTLVPWYALSGTNEPTPQELLNQMHGTRRCYGSRGGLPSILWKVPYISGDAVWYRGVRLAQEDAHILRDLNERETKERSHSAQHSNTRRTHPLLAAGTVDLTAGLTLLRDTRSNPSTKHVHIFGQTAWR